MFHLTSLAQFLNQRTGTANHGVKVGARRHHREDRVFLLHTEIDHVRTAMLAGLANRRNDIGSLSARTAAPGEVKRLGEASQKSGLYNGVAFVASLVEKFLPLPHHAQITVVDNGDLDVEALLRNGAERARPSSSENRRPPATTQTSASGRANFAPIAAGQSETHRAQTTRGN